MGSIFIFLRWFKLVHICFQVTGLHTGEEVESISKVLIGNRFHATLRIVSPTILYKQNLVLECKSKGTFRQKCFVTFGSKRKTIRLFPAQPENYFLLLMKINAVKGHLRCGRTGSNDEILRKLFSMCYTLQGSVGFHVPRSAIHCFSCTCSMLRNVH